MPKLSLEMNKIKNCVYNVSFFSLFSLIASLLSGCWGGSQASLPNAPPPHPDSPFPQGSVQNNYIPPLSPNPRSDAKKNSFYEESRFTSSPSSSYKSSEKFYTIEAIGTIWVLIQDKFGNELQWISLMSGEKFPLKHSGPLTITCSSGDSLKINDTNGKPYHIGEVKKGITIIRLP